MFKALLGQLIAKMLYREVWGYWYLTSQSGRKADLKELRKPWADPVCSKFTSNCGLLLTLRAPYSSIGVEMDCYLNAFILSMRSDAKILSP